MKKYNQMIIIVILLYFGLSIFAGTSIVKMEHDSQNQYRIEINRILEQLKDKESLENLQIEKFTYIKNVDFLSDFENNATVISEFYQEESSLNVMIKPWLEDNQLKGYLKFTYQLPRYNEKNILVLVEGCLLSLFIFILCIMLYIRKFIVRPFHQLSDLPEKLAYGHFKGDIKIEKSRYFQKFLWGMSQLKDSLDTSKNQQYDVLKEKKQMLLSLSHDIKTPLNLIKLYGKALDENLYEDEKSRKHAIHQIQSKSEEIDRYVEQIIKSSKEDIIDFTIENTDFYLTDLIKNIVTIYEEQCILRNIRLHINSYKNRLLNGDIHRAQEVFENLFENAFKYGDGRLIEIDFYEEDYCQLIKVYNTGKCVSDNEFNHLFDSFYRGSNIDGKPGSGLGLYICKELMRKMNGSIFAQQEIEGMSFVLVFR